MKKLNLPTLKFIALILLTACGNGLFAQCQQMFYNGDFELGNFGLWNIDSTLPTPTVGGGARTGSYALSLGYDWHTYKQYGGASAASSPVFQLTAGGGLLDFWYEVNSFHGDDSKFKVNIISNTGVVLARALVAGDSSTGWIHVTYDLAQFASTYIRIQFSANTRWDTVGYGQNGYSAYFVVRVDDVHVLGNPGSTHVIHHCNRTVHDVVGSTVHTTFGTFRDSILISSGCDSVVTSTISYNPNIYNYTYSACPGGALNVHAGTHTYTQAGTYRDTLTQSNGCDSLVISNLQYYPVAAYTQSLNYCGGSYSFTVGTHNRVYTTRANTTYIDTLHGAAIHGCDSIVTTNVLYTPITRSQTIHACASSTINIHVGNHTYTQTGAYADTLTGIATGGCDSIVTTTIQYTPVTYSQSFNNCPGIAFNTTVGAHIYTAAGVYKDTLALASIGGCDSIVTTTLNYYSAAINTQSFNFCGSGSVTVNGHTYSPNTTTTYRDTLHGAGGHGCDSIIITIIGITPVPPVPSPVTSFTVSNGDTVNAINFSVVNDSLYAQWRGTTDSTGIPLRGARSLPAFRAINNGNTPITDTITVSARFRGYAYIAANNAVIKFSLVQRRFVDTIYLPNGGTGAIQVLKSPTSNVAYVLSYGFAPGMGHTAKCIYVLDLVTDQIIRTINYTYTAINRSLSDPTTYAGTMTISPDGNTLYIVGNTSYQQGFSLVKLNVNTGTSTIFTPQGLFDDAAHGICITPDGRYIYMSRYREGILKVDAASMTEVNTPGLSLAIGTTQVALSPNGQTLYAADRYDHFYIISTANDSIITTIPHVMGVTYAIAQGISFTPDSSYLLLLMGDNSNNLKVFKLNLATNTFTTLQTNTSETFDYHGGTPFPNVSITPDGREYYMHYTDFVYLRGVSYAGGVTGNYGNGIALSQPLGFGSVGDIMIPGQCTSPEIKFTITINPTKRYSQQITLCSGQSLTVAGHIHTTTGTYIDTLVHGSMYGTDSIITTQLTVLPLAASYQAFTFCGSGSVIAGGVTHSTSGYYVDTLHAASVNGCDSIINTNLVINPLVATPTVTVNNQTVCAGNTVAATSLGSLTGGYHYMWEGNNTAIGLAATGQDNVPSFVSSNNSSTTIIDTISVTREHTGYIYVGSAVIGRISVLDRLTNTLVTNIIGIANPAGISVNADGSRVYVTSQSTDKVFVINGSANTIMTNINVGSQPVSIAVNRTNDKVYVANYGAGTVSVIDTLTNAVTATVNVGTNPSCITINPNGKYVYVTNNSSNSLSVINTTTNTVTATINAISRPLGIAVNATGNRIYVVNQGTPGTVTVIDATTNTILDTIAVGNSPKSIVVSPDGNSVYVSNYADNTVSVINTVSNIVITTITVGTAPNGISVSPDGANVYVVDSSSHNVSVISIASNTVIASPVVTLSSNTTGNFITGSSCQSIPVKYTITVNPIPRYTQLVDLCTGSTITVGSHTYNTNGTYIDTLHNASIYGCDSIVTTQLTMHSPVTSTITTSICAGSNYAGHTSTGTFVDHYNTIYGCDSARTLNLTVIPNVTTTITASVCQGSSYAGHTSTGTYTDHYTSVTGCDSARTLHLTIIPNVTSTIVATICSGGSYAGHTTSGTYVDHYTSAGGCDSARTLNLTVYRPDTSITNITICSNQAPYNWNGQNYTGTGNYTAHLTGMHGCDSVARLNLTINNATTWWRDADGDGDGNQFIDSISCSQPLGYVNNSDDCNDNDANINSHLTWYIDMDNDGYGDTSQVYHGCDPGPPFHFVLNSTDCDDHDSSVHATFNFYVDNDGDGFGSQTIASVCAAGANTPPTGYATNNIDCNDALFNTSPPGSTSSTNNMSICQSQLPFVWNGFTFTGAGSQTATGLTNVAGCDSSATLNLTVGQPTSSVTNYTICQAALPYTWNGLTFTGAGSQTATGFTNAAGCDSTATLNLVVNAISASTNNLAICASQLPYNWNGLTFTAAGSQTVTGLVTALGCDSTATLNLTVNQPSSSTINYAICASALPYVWNGLTFTTAGSQTATGFTNEAGCDSTATLNLIVNAAVTYSFTETICAGDVYNFNGQTLSSPGIYNDTLVAQSGCDSLVTVNLQTNQLNTQASASGALCSAAQDNAGYQWIDCNTGQPINGATNQSYTATQNGSYACILFKGNCTDTTDCVTVTGLGINETEDYNFTVYPNPTNGFFMVSHNYPSVLGVRIVNTLGQVVATFELPTPTAHFDIQNLPAGVYQLQAWSGNKKQLTRLLVKK